MENENNSAVEEAARPVKKLVLKRKPVVKKAPKLAEPAAEQEAVQAEKPAEEAPAAEVKQEAAEASDGAVQKKRRGRPAKQQKEKEAGSGKKAVSKDAEEKETSEETAKEVRKEAPAQPEVQKEEPQEEREQKHFGNNRNQNQHNNNNNQKNKNKFNNNGKQDQRNNQKKPMTMDDIAISDAEYQEHLANRLIVSDVVATPVDELKERLAAMDGTSVEDYAEFKKQEVIVELLKAFSRNGGVIYATGTLEILSDGYGFLRSPNNSYLSGPEDVYVSAGIIKFLNLKTGDTIEGLMRTPKDNERFFAISRIASVNGDAPIVAKTRTSFDNLIPLYPDQRINLETERTDNDVSMRIINLFCPIGKGQRALITAPPRTGKTILLQQIANSITTNHPEIKLMVLLVDERPEEVTDMRRNVRGEVIASTFDEQATRHVTVAEMVIEKAKRLVEHGKDVVILLDSITRLARAYNQTVPASGKILSGGVDSNALHKPKRFFGAARNIENGGSLTIIASALIETGSRMDEVIFEEFKGTGNSEIVLDRRMADRRLYPAINIKKSGTRREDLLLGKDEAARIWLLRNAINGLEDLEMTEFLIDKMRKTKNNEAFLRSMNTGIVPEF
ncbi:MAG: transcription termination factor Rho [Spirochaetales bacterium]|nr:transcription termination factor Rho [Spirochaetales bacterium]MBQ5364972.1 transcription termination factor Rho [Spirochaetales bacterium]